MARRLNASRATVRGALAELEREGLIAREHGRGTRIMGDAGRAFGEVAVVFNSFAHASSAASAELAALIEGISLGLGSRRVPAYFCPASGYVSESLGTDALCSAARFAERLRSAVKAAVLVEWSHSAEVARALDAAGFPYVVANLEEEGDLRGVSVAIEDMGRMAAEFALRCGCTRVLVVAGGRRRPVFQKMARGFARGLGGAAPEWAECQPNRPSAREALLPLLAGSCPPDAIFVYGDERALGAMDALREAGLNVPKDVGLMCYGRNSEAVRSANVSGFVQPALEVGRAAVDLLADVCAGRTPDRRRVVQATFAPGGTMFL